MSAPDFFLRDDGQVIHKDTQKPVGAVYDAGTGSKRFSAIDRYGKVLGDFHRRDQAVNAVGKCPATIHLLYAPASSPRRAGRSRPAASR